MGHHVYLVCDRAFVAGLFERKVKKKFFLKELNRKTNKKIKREKNLQKKGKNQSIFFYKKHFKNISDSLSSRILET